jgi:hypothetical protein
VICDDFSDVQHTFDLRTSVSDALVPLMVTLLWLSMVAQMLIASPGT